MKNQLIAPFLLTLLVILILQGLYFLPPYSLGTEALRRVDLLSDLRPTVEESVACDSIVSTLPLPPKPDFVDSCRADLTCIEDYADSTMRGMEPFYRALSSGAYKERPVRIAYFGDSFIEADIFTADLREQLQRAFGGCGVGFVPAGSNISGYRQTVAHAYGGWEGHATTDSTGFQRRLQGLSGHYYIPRSGAYTTLRGQSKKQAYLDSCQQSAIYYRSRGVVKLQSVINKLEKSEHETNDHLAVQKCVVEGAIGQVKWEVLAADSAIFYGVAMDGLTGISLDNFSLRGGSGYQLAQVERETLSGFNRVRPYDLIVLQYGLNVATKLGRNYDGYISRMEEVVARVKDSFPEAGILLVSVGDRNYRNEHGELRTMPGVKNLIRYQQGLAIESNIAFWNLFQAMGGDESMVELVEKGMANRDYTHINNRGGEHLATLLVETLLFGKEQYEKRKAYEAQE